MSNSSDDIDDATLTVGDRVKVWFKSPGRWYSGTVAETGLRNRKNGARVKVEYDDGDVKNHNVESVKKYANPLPANGMKYTEGDSVQVKGVAALSGLEGGIRTQNNAKGDIIEITSIDYSEEQPPVGVYTVRLWNNGRKVFDVKEQDLTRLASPVAKTVGAAGGIGRQWEDDVPG